MRCFSRSNFSEYSLRLRIVVIPYLPNCPGTPQGPQKPKTPQQNEQECNASFDNSKIGKVVHFGSYVSFLRNTLSAITSYLVGRGTLGALTAEASNGAVNYSLTQGTATMSSRIPQAATSAISKASTAFSVGATLADIEQRDACWQTSDPSMIPYMPYAPVFRQEST